MRVLIADDLVDNRELYAAFLELEGFVVHQASDGEHALARVEESLPDVIVMGLSMPKLDGWETTRRLKDNARTRDIPIIIVTAIDDDGLLARAWAAGADAICLKPCLPTELHARIQAVCGRPLTSRKT